MKKQFLACIAFLLIAGAVSAQTLKDAIKMTDNEQFESAATVYKNLLKSDASNGDVYYYLGENHFRAEDVDSALAVYEKGIKAAPNNPLNYIGIGKVKMYEGKKAEAKASIDKALAMAGPKNVSVMVKAAEAYLATDNKDPQAAFNLLNTALKLDAKNPEIYILLGDAYLAQSNNGSEAIRNYEKAIDLDKSSVKAILRIGQLYGRAKNYQEALNYYRRAEKVDSTYAPAYSEQGELYYMAKQYDTALKKYKKYLELAGQNNLNARTRYASFLFLSKNYTDAIKELNAVRSEDSTNNILNRLLAYSYFETGDYANGMKYINRFFAGNPKKIFASDYEYLAKLQNKTGEDSLAIINYEKAFKMDSTQKEFLSDIASIYLKQKNYPEAITYYKKKIDMFDSNNPNDYFGLGRAYLYSKDFVNADSAFAQITRVQPTLGIGYFWRARANAQLDPDSKKGLALPHYEAFVERAGTPSEKNRRDLIEAYEYMGAYYYEKDKAKSKEVWTKLKEIDPNNVKAKKALEGLK